MPILERDDNAEALYLESRLASDPDFFCEVIRLIYRSNKEDKPVNEVDDSTKSIATMRGDCCMIGRILQD